MSTSNSALQFARLQGARGVTARELGEHMNTHHGSASGALSNLHRKGKLVRLQERRDRQSVYVLPEYVRRREQVQPRINQSSLTEAERAMIQSYRNREQSEPDRDEPQPGPAPDQDVRWVRIEGFNNVAVGDHIKVSYYEKDVLTVRCGTVGALRNGFALTSLGVVIASQRYTLDSTGVRRDTRPGVGWWRQVPAADGLALVWARDVGADLIGHTVQFTDAVHGHLDTVLYGFEHGTVRGKKVGLLQHTVSLLLLDENLNPTWYEIPPDTRLIIDAE